MALSSNKRRKLAAAEHQKAREDSRIRMENKDKFLEWEDRVRFNGLSKFQQAMESGSAAAYFYAKDVVGEQEQ